MPEAFPHMDAVFFSFTFRALSGHFLSKVTVIHTYKHTAMQGADHQDQEQFGVQYLAKGHFNMQTRGTEPVTF